MLIFLLLDKILEKNLVFFFLLVLVLLFASLYQYGYIPFFKAIISIAIPALRVVSALTQCLGMHHACLWHFAQHAMVATTVTK